MLRVGLYARVSTNDQQTLPMQSRAMREYAARRGWTITMQVREVGSGAEQREAREKLLEAARRREIDVVLVWRLDRWGRSVTDLLATLQELEHLGVASGQKPFPILPCQKSVFRPFRSEMAASIRCIGSAARARRSWLETRPELPTARAGEPWP
jgi:hypothetical protein